MCSHLTNNYVSIKQIYLKRETVIEAVAWPDFIPYAGQPLTALAPSLKSFSVAKTAASEIQIIPKDLQNDRKSAADA